MIDLNLDATPRQKWILAALIAVLIVYYPLRHYAVPLWESYSQLREQHHALRTELAMLPETKHDTPALEQANDQAQQDIQSMLYTGPTDTASLRLLIEPLLTQHRAQLQDFDTVLGGTEDLDVSVIRATLALNVSYTQLFALLQGLSERVDMSLQGIEIQGEQTPMNPRVTITFIAPVSTT